MSSTVRQTWQVTPVPVHKLTATIDTFPPLSFVLGLRTYPDLHMLRTCPARSRQCDGCSRTQGCNRRSSILRGSPDPLITRPCCDTILLGTSWLDGGQRRHPKWGHHSLGPAGKPWRCPPCQHHCRLVGCCYGQRGPPCAKDLTRQEVAFLNENHINIGHL